MALSSGGLLERNDSEIVLSPNQRKLLKIQTVTCMIFLCSSNPISLMSLT